MSSKAPESGVISEGRGGSKGLLLAVVTAGAAALVVSEAIKRIPPPCPTPAEVACHTRLKANCELINPGRGIGIVPKTDAQETVLKVAQGVCRSINNSVPQCGTDYCTRARMTDNALNQLGL